MRLGIHPIQGTSVIGGLKIVPLAAQVLPCRVPRLDERDLLLLAATLFSSFLPCDRPLHLLVRFEPDQPIAVVPRGKPIVLPPFVLEDPFAADRL